jgi:hypothetical protein
MAWTTPKPLHLSEEEIERRCALVDFHYGVYRRHRARTFEEWLNFQAEVDRAFRAMGYIQNGYTQLVDTELIFPQVRRCFNGQDKD